MRHILAVITVVVISACGGGSPTAPSSPPLAQPDIVAVGDATFNCPKDGGGNCTYGFQITNRGPGCAVRVRGTLELRNAAGVIFASDTWELPAEQRIVPQATVGVGDCCVREEDTDAATSVRVVVQAEAVSCQ